MPEKIIGVEVNPYKKAPSTSKFAIPMTNRPPINVRQEFLATKRWLEDTGAGDTPDHVDVTALVQHTILGLESYLQSAAHMAVILTNTDTESRQPKIRRLVARSR